ncbi:hypothetical protein D3C75_1064680 [compost metagenome]
MLLPEPVFHRVRHHAVAGFSITGLERICPVGGELADLLARDALLGSRIDGKARDKQEDGHAAERKNSGIRLFIA